MEAQAELARSSNAEIVSALSELTQQVSTIPKNTVALLEARSSDGDGSVPGDAEHQP